MNKTVRNVVEGTLRKAQRELGDDFEFFDGQQCGTGKIGELHKLNHEIADLRSIIADCKAAIADDDNRIAALGDRDGVEAR